MDVRQQTEGDLIHESPPNPSLEQDYSDTHTQRHTHTRAQVYVHKAMCIFALIIAARLLLRADVVLVRLLISIRMDYFVFGVVSNKLSMKHQKLKAGKWKLGGYETGITIKANLSFTFCTPGKNVPEQVHCVF